MAKSRLLNVIKRAPADLRLFALVISSGLLGILSVWFAYEIVLRPQTAFYIQYRRFMKADVEPTVVFLADSRAVYGLRNAAMDRQFYNYASFGEAPYGQILRARHVMRDKPSVRVFVMQMDAYVVGGQRSYRPLPASRGFYEALLYSSLRDVDEVIGPKWRDKVRSILGLYFPLSIWWERVDFWGAVRQSLTSIGLDDASPPSRYFTACGDLTSSADDWLRLDATERLKVAFREAAVRYKDSTLDPHLAAMIRDFIAYARARGVTVIGLRMPETREFREASRPMIDPSLEAFAGSLGIPILDYREAYSARADLFVDADHLTDIGAADLSRRVAADLRKMLALRLAEPLDCPAMRLIDYDPAMPFAWLLR